MIIPEWMDIDRKVEAGAPLSPLETLIHGHEPAGVEHESRFRRELSDALDYVWNLAASTSAKEVAK